MRAFIIFLATVFTVSHLGAQRASSSERKAAIHANDMSSSGVKHPVPLEHLYLHLFLYQHHLDEAASREEIQGKDGGWLRNRFKEQFNLTPAQFLSLEDSSASFVKQNGLLQERARAELQNSRNKKLAEGLPLSHAIVHTPSIDSIISERTQVLTAEISHLKSQLGSIKSAELDGYLQNAFTKHITTFVPRRTDAMRTMNQQSHKFIPRSSAADALSGGK